MSEDVFPGKARVLKVPDFPPPPPTPMPGSMTTPESRTVEERPEIKDWLTNTLVEGMVAERATRGGNPESRESFRFLATFLLAAAKEHGLVIGEGELDRAWKEAEEARVFWFDAMVAEDSEGEFFEEADRGGFGLRLEGQSESGYTAMLMDWSGSYTDGLEEADGSTPTAALNALTVKLRESR